MSLKTQPRVLPGIPTAGQWAAVRHAEPSLSLGATFSDSTLDSLANRNPSRELATIEMTPEILQGVRSHLDATGDFSGTGVRQAAEEAYELQNGYTLDEYQRYLTTNGDISNFHADPDAVRHDIEQLRKDDHAAATAA